jgi:hypothetical protein
MPVQRMGQAELHPDHSAIEVPSTQQCVPGTWYEVRAQYAVPETYAVPRTQ